jgi:hypothetical protein
MPTNRAQSGGLAARLAASTMTAKLGLAAIGVAFQRVWLAPSVRLEPTTLLTVGAPRSSRPSQRPECAC